MTGRFSGFRTGALAVPMYLIFMGAGHCQLAPMMESQATGPRDGQAFAVLFVLGFFSIVLGVITLPVMLSRERGAVALFRAAVVGVVVAGAVVAYTASRGVERGGEVGVPLPCIVEQGRQVCPGGDGTYIKSPRPDVPVMFLAGTLVAYAAAHFLGRLRLGK